MINIWDTIVLYGFIDLNNIADLEKLSSYTAFYADLTSKGGGRAG